MKEWVRQADPDTEDLRQFVRSWAETWPKDMKTPSDLMGLATEIGVFPWTQMAKTAAGAVMSFSKRVLRKHMDRPVEQWIIRTRGSGSTTLYYLETL